MIFSDLVDQIKISYILRNYEYWFKPFVDCYAEKLEILV